MNEPASVVNSDDDILSDEVIRFEALACDKIRY
jgi:hypothetical protein